MRVRRIDQNSATPIDTFQRFRHTSPNYGKNNEVALGCLLLGPCDGAWTEISDKIGQCRRTPGIGYNYGMTSGYQMAAECTRYLAGTYKTYFHNPPPFGCQSIGLRLATFIGVTDDEMSLPSDTVW